jgi:GDPmannose 4,6-dehydratase
MKALITGINGQDGSYLAEFLLDKGYEVAGIYRRSSSPNLSRIEKIKNKVTLFEGDITDYSFIQNVWAAWQPHEIYNLAAQSHVQTSFVNPIYTANVNYVGVLNWLELLAFIAQFKQRPFQPKLYQASTSEMFGNSYTPIFTGNEWKNVQNESTKFNPQSPYSIAKLAAHHACRLYREAHGVQVSCGILFNHESPRRGDEFVTKKITNYVKQLKSQREKIIDIAEAEYDSDIINDFDKNYPKLKLGNLNAKRDWGYAPDYVEAMWLMLQQDNPDDYVISTGETHTVEEFLVEAFSLIGVLDIFSFIEIDQSLKRPAEVNYLCGDSTKAREKLGWKPKVSFKELVKIMVEN